MNVEKGLAHLRIADSKIGQLIDAFGEPDFGRETNYFESLVRAMVYQQLSGKSAATIYRRFKNLFEGDHYPTPKEVLNKSHDELRSAGLSGQKAGYVHNIAEAFSNGSVPEHLEELSDNDVRNHLTAIKGVGPWTAEMFLMFTLQRPDILPVTDLGIQKGMQLFCKLDELPTMEFMLKTSQLWRPYRTLASWYLWRLVEGPFEW